MLDILFVDDNKNRTRKFVTFIEKSKYYNLINLYCCESADAARVQLKTKQYDLLILDVVLPKKNDSELSPKNGFNLLHDIYNKQNLLIPNKIIGITGELNDIQDFRNEFFKFTSVIKEAKYNSSIWIKEILTEIELITDSKIKASKPPSTKILITVHGIRTFGKWQEKTSTLLETYSQHYNNYSIKYGYFSIFSFLIPVFRKNCIKKVRDQLSKICNENSNKEINIIAHSFGTYLIIKSISALSKNYNFNTLILCGSVMKNNFDIFTFGKKHKICRIINDCSKNDFVLVLSKILILGLGDAGRTGFNSPNCKRFVNRFFSFGHSGYFNFDKNNSFVKKQWIPYLLNREKLVAIDNRRSSLISDFTEFIIFILSEIKYSYYFIFLLLLSGLL